MSYLDLADEIIPWKTVSFFSLREISYQFLSLIIVPFQCRAKEQGKNKEPHTNARQD